ncbi:hypothetical protein RI129_003908 [Pyrocoelia pectoralis]|uniref:Uncharacterized protein n=1 Tax=Pyrocoelia pectoralis TaxID=417401 RepID=A0AAN7VQG9_9COLE
MLAVLLITSLLASAHCFPSEALEKEESPLKPDPPIAEEPKLLEKAPEDPQPAEIIPVPESGAALPEDIAASSDANPAAQPENSDLDTDATFWGLGYRRPYFGGWRNYYSSPWRRWGGYGGYGYGRGYGGWGWGRGWGWNGGYW